MTVSHGADLLSLEKKSMHSFADISCADILIGLALLGLMVVLCRFGLKEAERGKFGPQYGLKWKTQDKDDGHGP